MHDFLQTITSIERVPSFVIEHTLFLRSTRINFMANSLIKSPPETHPNPRDRMINRELGLLRFNERVLALAADESVPLLERWRYLCISASNLDEFFEVRVAGTRQKVMAGVESAGMDGLSPSQELTLITQRAQELTARQYELLNTVLLPSLAKQSIQFIRRTDWTAELQAWVTDLFITDISPVLSPLALDLSHPFPRLMNKGLTFIIELEGSDAFGRDPGYALLRVPRSLPRVIRVPKDISGVENGFVFLSSVVHANVESLFSGMTPKGMFQFKVTRNSELYVHEEDVANLKRAVEHELLQRSFGQAVRLEIDQQCTPTIVKFLQKHFCLEDNEVHRVCGPVNLNRMIAIPDQIDRPDLKFEAFRPAIASYLTDDNNIFETIAQHSPLVSHHPYESYIPVTELVRQAAQDPAVLAIKQTLYRTGRDSIIVEHLMEASRRGKDVTVVIELLARFDEEANLSLANQLQETGIQVVYGVVGFKTHAKMLLVVRREKSGLRRYVHVGTGNYHTTTARTYTDISLLTDDPIIAEDINRVFQQLTGVGQELKLTKLAQAPFRLHKFILKRIAAETRIAEAGGKGQIIARMNSLVDPGVVNALYRASQSGVQIDLIVRGICVLRPQVPGLSDNIRVVSVLGRFLEHSRVFYFRNGSDGKANDNKNNDGKNNNYKNEEVLYISSADWMPRNFFKRVEIAIPVTGKALKRIKHECLDLYLRDNSSSWEMLPNGEYTRRTPNDAKAVNVQKKLIRLHQSDFDAEG